MMVTHDPMMRILKVRQPRVYLLVRPSSRLTLSSDAMSLPSHYPTLGLSGQALESLLHPLQFLVRALNVTQFRSQSTYEKSVSLPRRVLVVGDRRPGDSKRLKSHPAGLGVPQFPLIGAFSPVSWLSPAWASGWLQA